MVFSINGRRVRHRGWWEQRADLAAIVEKGPYPAVDCIIRWRRIDLRLVIRKRFGIDYDTRYMGKLLLKLGFSHISARPQHPAQDAHVVDAPAT